MDRDLSNDKVLPQAVSGGRRIKVAFMLTPVEFGGAERVCATLIKSIDRSRFEVVPIVFTRPWESGNVFVRVLAQAGYNCYQIPVAKKEEGDHIRVARVFWLVWKRLRAERFNLIHTNGYFADIVGIPAARLIGLPSITTCHGYISSTWKTRLYNAIDRLALKLGSQVIAVSEGIRNEIVSFGLSEQRVLVIPNSVDFPSDISALRSHRSTGRSALGIGEDDFVIGFVGRLSYEKGLTHLFEAFSSLVDDGVSAILLIVGDGPQRVELEQLSIRCGIWPRVRFAGFQEIVSDWLICMDVFVLPSLTEGTPMALLEAMAHGVPAIASAVGGVPQVIHSGETGILISPRSPSAIRNALLVLHRSPTTREALARNAWLAGKKRYGIRQWIEQIESAYQYLSQ